MELIRPMPAINPGNSGACTAQLQRSAHRHQLLKAGQHESYEGMGFAIPVNTALTVIKDIIENKDNPSPYIGIEVYTYNSAYLEKIRTASRRCGQRRCDKRSCGARLRYKPVIL